MRGSSCDEVDDGVAEDSVVSLMDDWLENSSEEDVFSLVEEDDSAFWHPQDNPAINRRNAPKTIFFLAIAKFILGPVKFVVKRYQEIQSLRAYEGGLPFIRFKKRFRAMERNNSFFPFPP